MFAELKLIDEYALTLISKSKENLRILASLQIEYVLLPSHGNAEIVFIFL